MNVISILNKLEKAKELEEGETKHKDHFKAYEARNKRIADRINKERKKHNERLKKEYDLS